MGPAVGGPLGAAARAMICKARRERGAEAVIRNMLVPPAVLFVAGNYTHMWDPRKGPAVREAEYLSLP